MMIEIDGSQGEGGGAVVRVSVALSAVTGKEIRIDNIRARRSNPGLRAQHLTGIRAVAELCNAEVDGAELHSKEIEFKPSEIQARRINVDVGTAGSITLVLQALMVPAVFADKRVRVRVTGGTDVKWSPPIDYLRYVTLPLLEKFGYDGKVEVERRGYYPEGGGKVTAEFGPSEFTGIDLTKRGRILSAGGISHAHQNLEKGRVARRQARSARPLLYRRLSNEGVDSDISIKQEYCESPSYGSGLVLWAKTENSVIGSDSLGEKGRTAERVGQNAAKNLLRELDSGAPLDRWMGDQIAPYLALAGGAVRVSEITEHARTNVMLANKFGFDVRIKGNEIRAVRRPPSSRR